jgi:hypothetical protein
MLFASARLLQLLASSSLALLLPLHARPDSCAHCAHSAPVGSSCIEAPETADDISMTVLNQHLFCSLQIHNHASPAIKGRCCSSLQRSVEQCCPSFGVAPVRIVLAARLCGIPGAISLWRERIFNKNDGAD